MQNSRFGRLLFIWIFIQIFAVGCETSVQDSAPKIENKAEKADVFGVWTIDDSNTIADLSGEVPVYRLKLPVPISDKMEFNIALDAFKKLNIGGVESLIVPMEGGKEVPEPWPVHAPSVLSKADAYVVSFSRDELEYSMKKCVGFSNLKENPDFSIRLIFSNSEYAYRASLIVAEIELK